MGIQQKTIPTIPELTRMEYSLQITFHSLVDVVQNIIYYIQSQKNLLRFLQEDG